MNKEKAVKLVSKLSNPNNVHTILLDGGDAILLDANGNNLGEYIQNELKAIIFKEEHPLAPRKWRSWTAKNKEKF